MRAILISSKGGTSDDLIIFHKTSPLKGPAISEYFPTASKLPAVTFRCLNYIQTVANGFYLKESEKYFLCLRAM
jgi:hypothetical protein